MKRYNQLFRDFGFRAKKQKANYRVADRSQTVSKSQMIKGQFHQHLKSNILQQSYTRSFSLRTG